MTRIQRSIRNLFGLGLLQLLSYSFLSLPKRLGLLGLSCYEPMAGMDMLRLPKKGCCLCSCCWQLKVCLVGVTFAWLGLLLLDWGYFCLVGVTFGSFLWLLVLEMLSEKQWWLAGTIDKQNQDYRLSRMNSRQCLFCCFQKSMACSFFGQRCKTSCKAVDKIRKTSKWHGI